ncbi:unnamed protein product [Trichobilharzia szidati]|nr:unnamed protein product [Trichobilharzia szidati]
MTSVISRHTSTVSLISQNSVQLEAGLLVQCLNRYKEHLECGCEKVLDSKFSKKGLGMHFCLGCRKVGGCFLRLCTWHAIMKYCGS